jgi:HAD superfamily hydrolase (TIGR01509 family)
VAVPQLVIFDCDGVLVDSERISNHVLAANLSRLGLEMGMEESRRRFQGRLLADIARLAEAELGRPLPPGWPDLYERERDVAFRAELKPVAGAREAVQGVRAAGAQVCVASQGRLAKSQLTLSLTGLRDLFGAHAVFSAEMVPRGKPDPDLFLHAAAAMGAPPSACAVVEDSASGVLAARAAAMRVLAYSADADPAALREAGAELIDSMLEVPARLGFAGR